MSNDSAGNVLVAYRMDQARAALEEALVLHRSGYTTLGVVNRAYYAMFYAVLALLQKSGHAPRKHAGVIALFDSEFVRKGHFDKIYSRHLHQAFNLRQTSDYQPGEPVDEDTTDTLLKNAAAFIRAVEEVL